MADVRIAVALARSRDVDRRKLDRNAEVEPNAADRVGQIVESVLRIAARVRHDDESAAPRDHFPQAEIFVVAAVRQVHERIADRSSARAVRAGSARRRAAVRCSASSSRRWDCRTRGRAARSPASAETRAAFDRVNAHGRTGGRAGHRERHAERESRAGSAAIRSVLGGRPVPGLAIADVEAAKT